MTTTSVMIACLIVYAIGEFIAAMFIRRSRKRYESFARVELTRFRFAEVRHELFKLVVDHELDSRSETFRRLYRMHTFILRRPDQFHEIAEELRRDLSTPSANDESDGLSVEASQWNQRTRQVVRGDRRGFVATRRRDIPDGAVHNRIAEAVSALRQSGIPIQQ